MQWTAKHDGVLIHEQFCTVSASATEIHPQDISLAKCARPKMVTAFLSRRDPSFGGFTWLKSDGAGTKSRLQRAWAFLRRPSSMAWSSLVIAGGVAGIMFWGGFNWALELTNTEIVLHLLP